jgi:hypothetical protein
MELHLSLASYSTEERHQLGAYLSRPRRGRPNQQQLRLWTLLSQNPEMSDRDLQQTLYPDNPNAFYRLKHSLLQEAGSSLLAGRRPEDEEDRILQTLLLARAHSRQARYAEAASNLTRAEREARKLGHLDLLRLCLRQQRELALAYQGIDATSVSERRRSAEAELAESERLSELVDTLTCQLRNANYGGKSGEVLAVLDQLARDLDLEHLRNKPAARLRLDESIRGVMLERGAFEQLEDYLRHTLQEFDQMGWNTRNWHRHKLVLRSWLLNTCIKRRRFSQAKTAARQLEGDMQRFGGMHREEFRWTLEQGRFAAAFYAGDLDAAATSLQEMATLLDPRQPLAALVAVAVNRAILLYCKGQSRAALDELAAFTLQGRDRELSENLRVSLGILELVLLLESGESNWFEERLRRFRREHRSAWHNPAYQQEKLFIRALAHGNRHLRWDGPAARSLLRQARPFEPGSSDFIAHAVWLSARQQGRDYYEALCDAVTFA